MIVNKDIEALTEEYLLKIRELKKEDNSDVEFNLEYTDEEINEAIKEVREDILNKKKNQSDFNLEYTNQEINQAIEEVRKLLYK